MSAKSYDPYDLGYVAGQEAAIEKYDYLESVSRDVLHWLEKNGFGGTAHARTLSEALDALTSELTVL